jgi:hypothetical protein
MGPVDVVNTALGMMGDDFIISLTPPDDTDRARLAKVLYEPLLKVAMHEAPFNFTLKRVTLSPDSDAPPWGYKYQFQIPTDSLRVWRMKDKSIEFKVEGDKILCDETPVYIIYIRYIEDPNKWDPHFTEAFCYKLASRMSPLLGSDSKSEKFDKWYKDAIKDAILDDFKEGYPEKFSSDVLTDVRVGGTGRIG